MDLYIKLIKIYIYKIGNFFVPNFVKKIIAFRNRHKSMPISKEKLQFISLNTEKWKNSQKGNHKNGYVLVEGFLASYGPNYLLRTGVISKAIEENKQLIPLVLFNNYLEYEKEKIKLYQSFDINNFLSVKNFHASFFRQYYIKFIAKKFFHKVKEPKDLLKLKYKNIVFGDLLYDTILKDFPNESTIKKVSERELKYITQAINYITIYRKLLKKRNIKLFVATHTQFLMYGLLFRTCLSKNIPVIETTDIQFWFHKNNSKDGSFSDTKFHEYMHRKIKEISKNEKILISDIDNILEDRFSAKFDQSDVRRAYKDKKTYNSNELRKKLNIDNENPFVYVFAHIFSDSPQIASRRLLFPDYYTWLEETIDFISKIDYINWIIKPHPAYIIYNEKGMVENLINKYKNSSVYLSPSDLNPVSVVETAKAIVTAQGTVGIEYSCMGVPVLLSGTPFYSGFGFTIEPNSIENYLSKLKEIDKVQKLSKNQIIQAKKVFGAFMKMQQTDTSIIDTNVLLAVWGDKDVKPSVDRAFNTTNNKFKNINLRKYSLYLETKKLIPKTSVKNILK